MIKRLTAILLVLALILSAGSALAAKKEKKVKEPDVLDFVTTEKVVTSGDFDFDLVFEVMHESFAFHKAEHPGTNFFLDYTTDVYEDGVTYEKWCRVYLPYGYDPEDTSKKYNVIYFQHGNNGSPNEFFDIVDQKTFGYGIINIFDNMPPEAKLLRLPGYNHRHPYGRSDSHEHNGWQWSGSDPCFC